MKRLLTLAGIAGFGALLAGPAVAQQSATIVLRNGERLAGQIVDMTGSGLVAEVSGQSRTLPLGDVAVIDFTGAGSFPANEVSQVGAGEHVLVLRDGSVLKGHLFDIGGRSPLRISFTTGGTTRDFTSDQVARIYFAQPGGGATSSSGTSSVAAPSGSIRVPANAGWVNTGIQVRQGQTLLFNTSGEVRLSTDPEDVATPAGSKKGRRVQNGPLPGALAGALVGRIGNGPPFGIGDQTSIVAPASGTLFLTVNDDVMNDNTGEFVVTVTPQGSPRRR